MSPLLIAYLALVPPAIVVCARITYQLPLHPEPGHFAGGNRRSAALIGILYGVCWPALVALLIVFAVCLYVHDWVKAGAAR